MSKLLAKLLYVAAVALVMVYLIVAPSLATVLTGSDLVGRVVASANLALAIAWGLRTGGIKIELGFRPAPKGLSIEIPTAFSTAGIEAVEKAIVSITERPMEPRCADPATCGSEWTAGLDIGSPTIAVMCSRCGRSGHLDPETSAEFRVAAAEATARG